MKQNCNDCGIDTKLDNKDYYMVSAEIWNKYGLGEGKVFVNKEGAMCGGGESGFLCMKCLEERMGRKLKKSDIFICPITQFFNPYTKKILSQK